MEKTENIMGTRKVMPLLISMSVPPMISMLIQALYNIVDSMYVARISEDALTAVSIAFPLQNLIIAVSCGFGIGLNSCVARALGAKDEKEVTSAATHGFLLSGVHWILFVLMGIFLTGPFLRNFTTNPQIYEMSCQYTQIVLCFSIGSMYHLYAEKLFQSTGSMILPMIFQGVGAVLNIILDPVFIFGWFNIPAMGVQGAAIATVASQIFAAVLSMIFFLKKCTSIRIHLKGFHFEKSMLWKLYTVGIPSAIMMSLPSVLVAALNSVLAAFSATAIAVFGLYIKIQTFVYMPANGVIQGMRPIMSYNYGAGNKERVTKTLKHCVAYAVSIMAVGLLLFQLFPKQLLSMFQASDTMLSIGVPALRIISLSFLLAGFGISCSSIFQALGKAVYSMCISIARQLVILLPAAYLLAQSGNVNLVWWAFPIAELVSVGATAFFLMKINRSIVSRIGQ